MEENIISPFEIRVTLQGSESLLRVEPDAKDADRHEYRIFEGQQFLGTVWPDGMDHGTCWYSSDEIPEDTLIKIGDAIERYEC